MKFAISNGVSNWKELAYEIVDTTLARIPTQDHDLRRQWIVVRAQLKPIMAPAYEAYRQRSSGKISREEYGAVLASVEIAVRNEIENRCHNEAAWQAARSEGFGSSGAASSRKAFTRGDDERHTVDSYWGEGTYDSEFATDDMIDEAEGQ